MAARETSLKLTLKAGSFQAGMRKLTSQVAASGRMMGNAMAIPLSAGLRSAKNTLGGMGKNLVGYTKTAATLGGALSFGMLIRDGMKMNHIYRNIAFNISKLPQYSISWQQVQEIVKKTVMESGQSANELAEAFDQIFKATGDLEFSKKALEAIGTVSTASGENIMALAKAADLAARKFGILPEEIDEALTRFIEKTGVGGKSLDELTSRFALVAGEAAAAGTKGGEGISELLALLLLLDSSIGEKADPGLKMMFQTVKDGTSAMMRLRKQAGIKFDPGMSALEKIKRMLATEKGRKQAELLFTADARVVFDELAKPFDEAFKKAEELGFKRAEAVKAGLTAFDENIRKASVSTMKFKDIQNEAAKRLEEDPTMHLKKAIETISEAFADKKMIEAIKKLTKHLPKLAEQIVHIIEWIMENPLKTGAAIVGAKVGVPAATAAVSATVAAKIAAAKVAAGAVVPGAIPAVTAGATTVTGALALGAAGIVAAGGAGAAAGYTAYKLGVEPGLEKNFNALQSIDETIGEALGALKETKTIEHKRQVLEKVAVQMMAVERGPGIATKATGAMVEMFTGGEVKGAAAQWKAREEELIRAQILLKKSIEETANSMKKMSTAADGAGDNLDKMSDKTKPSTTRGTVGGLRTTPGATPTKG